MENRPGRKIAKRFSLASFPQYVSKVQNKMTELKQQSLANVRKYDQGGHNAYAYKSKRGRSPRMLFCFDSETSPIVRQKPLPRTLSPLKTKPNPENLPECVTSSTQRHKKRRSRNMHTWNKTLQPPLAPPAQRKSPHLTIPLNSGVSIRSLSSSSSGSSHSSSPLPDVLLSPAVLSAHSMSSGEQSPLVKKSIESPFHLASPTPLHKSTSLPQLEHKSSKQNLPPAHTPKLPGPVRTLVRPSHASPYLTPVTRLKPLERPVRNPSGKNSVQTKKRHQRQQSMTKVQNDQLSPGNVGQSSKRNTKLDQPVWSSAVSVAVENTANSNLQAVDTTNCSLREPPVQTSQPIPGLSIPTITIRSATPGVKTPSGEESLVSLCKQFVFRAELVQELDELKDELKSIAETNSSLGE